MQELRKTFFTPQIQEDNMLENVESQDIANRDPSSDPTAHLVFDTVNRDPSNMNSFLKVTLFNDVEYNSCVQSLKSAGSPDDGFLIIKLTN